MNITIFGGSQPKEGERAYRDAYQLGKLLARSHHAVVTGGYIGTMEAVSRGAAEEGGHVIGITCSQIESWRFVRPNKWIVEERHFDTLQDRLRELITIGDTYLALPGGPGTLTEIALTWNMMIVEALPSKPMILIGNEWKDTFDTIFINMASNIPQQYREMLRFARDIYEAHSLVPKSNL